jgi:hypothetical protein
MTPKAQEKNRQTGLNENLKIRHKNNYQQNKKATHRIGENIYKSYV